jgi:hypothetical protein
MQNQRLFVVLAVAFAAACSGGGNGTASSTVGASGATLTSGAATLTIPSGALTQNVQVTVTETQPRHSGRTERVEISPAGTALAQPARLSIHVDDTNVHVKMHDGSDDSLKDVEVEDRNHGDFKTTMNSLGAVEVELEHGATCTPACASGQECDDGVCKAHDEDASKRTCSPVCASGQECDDGACKTHDEAEHADAGTAACTPACATGLECDDGVCKAHGG